MCAVDQAAGALRGQNGALNWAERQPHSITDTERVITEKETQGTFWEERHDFIGALGQVTAMWGVSQGGCQSQKKSRPGSTLGETARAGVSRVEAVGIG